MSNHTSTPTADATPTADEYSLADLPGTDATDPGTDENGFPATYEDVPAPPTTPETTVTTATADKPAPPSGPEANGTLKAPKAPKAKKAPKAPKSPKAKVQKAGSELRTGRAKKPRVYGGPRVPAGVVRVLPLDVLTFDRRLQSRASMYDDDAVERYRLINLDDPDRLPAIKAVDIGDDEAEKRKTTRYLVWDGFQRGRARREAKLGQIKVEVVTGTFDDAVRYSLGANGGHGLARTSADLRRAFQRLIDNETLLELVIKDSRGKGGPQAGIARAIDVSTGMVNKLLQNAGLAVRGDKLVNRPKPTEAQESQHTRTQSDPSGGARVEDPKQIKSRATASVIKEMAFAAAQIQRRFESLIERDDAQNLLRELASRNGIPVKRDENPSANGKRVVVTEYWPAADMLLKTLEELAEEHGKMNTSSTV